MNRLLLLLLLLLLRLAPAATQAPAAPTDVLLRTDGTEVPGRVLTITPLEVRYLPPAGADTLRLPVADVFLVRYANGTREMLHPVAPAAAAPQLSNDLLPGLSDAQRRALARRDASRGYTDRGPFWGALGATLYGGPLLGIVGPACIAPHAVAAHQLGAPRPELLTDPAYNDAYRSEAQHRKRGRAWGGYGVGVGVWVLLIGALAASGP